MSLFKRSRLNDILHDYVAGDLDEASRREVERRIASDRRVRARLDEIVAAHDALRTLRERPEPPVGADDVLPSIRAAIAARQFEERPKLYLESRGRYVYKRLAIAATLMLAVTVTLWITGGGTPRPADRPPAQDPRARVLVPANPLEPVSDVGIDALKVIEMLEREGKQPKDLRYTPNDGVLPISDGVAERR